MVLHQGRNGSLLTRLFEPERTAGRGGAGLAKVFWGYGVLVSSAVVLLHASALMLRQAAFQEVLIVASTLYTAWIVVAIWRRSSHAHPYWGTLAQWLTVVWALNSGLVLVFLQIELLVRTLGR